MRELESNIINLFADKGRSWLANLPSIVAQLAQQWRLSATRPVHNMTFNYVSNAMQDNKIPVVLKISCTPQMIADEIKALEHFNAHGSIKLLNINYEFNAILLEQAIPGESLKSIYPQQLPSVLEHYVIVAKKLASIALPHNNEFKHIRDWLTAIDRADKKIIPQHLLQTAIRLKNDLLNTPQQDYILHGDLHHDNIINNANQWLAIDPKGITGNIEFEAAAFISGNIEAKPKQSYEKIISTLADKLAIDPECLTAWVFVRLILAACWMVEDNGDPTAAIKMSQHFVTLLPNNI